MTKKIQKMKKNPFCSKIPKTRIPPIFNPINPYPKNLEIFQDQNLKDPEIWDIGYQKNPNQKSPLPIGLSFKCLSEIKHFLGLQFEIPRPFN